MQVWIPTKAQSKEDATTWKWLPTHCSTSSEGRYHGKVYLRRTTKRDTKKWRKRSTRLLLICCRVDSQQSLNSFSSMCEVCNLKTSLIIKLAQHCLISACRGWSWVQRIMTGAGNHISKMPNTHSKTILYKKSSSPRRKKRRERGRQQEDDDFINTFIKFDGT